jgi:hypothetical protein
VKQIPLSLRLLTSLGLALPLGLMFTSLAQASWSSSGAGTGSALAYTMPTGAQPSVSRSGSNVTVSWTAALFSDGRSVAGYVIDRYNASNGNEVTIGASCNTTITTTTCTELSVPAGTWTYTDTPVQDNWAGGQSPASAAVTVP